MSKLTQEEVRSIHTMNYSPSINTDRSKAGSPSPKNKKVMNTMARFKMMHAEEASNLSRGFNQTKSSKNLSNDLKINLISADGKSSPTKRNNSFRFNISKRHSNISMDPQHSHRDSNFSKNQLFVNSEDHSKQIDNKFI